MVSYGDSHGQSSTGRTIIAIVVKIKVLRNVMAVQKKNWFK